jgi:hypothetical protein
MLLPLLVLEKIIACVRWARCSLACMLPTWVLTVSLHEQRQQIQRRQNGRVKGIFGSSRRLPWSFRYGTDAPVQVPDPLQVALLVGLKW